MVPWPVEYGGRGADLIEWLIFEEEYYRAQGAGTREPERHLPPRPTLMEFGTPAQKARYLPRMACGDEVWAQGWSEPNAGSDMAAIRATARLDGDHYVLNGQKTWCSRAAFADWLFGIFRTDPASERHRGLTFILVPLRRPASACGRSRSSTARPASPRSSSTTCACRSRTASARRARAGRSRWRPAGFERGLMLRSPARFQATARRLIGLYRRQAAAADPVLRDAVVRAWMDAEAYALNTYWTACRLIAGGTIGAEASLNKIFWSEMDLRMHETALGLLGRGRRAHRPMRPPTPTADGWLDGFPLLARRSHLRRHQRDPAERHRGASPPPPRD
jgi:acyl-CoA dehydrogenase